MREDGFTGLTWRIGGAEAAASGILAAANAAYFACYSAARVNRARRAGALALVLINLALAGEGALYLTLASPADDGARALATVAVRTLLLAAVATMAAVIARREAARIA